jgi:hypothetical protein
MLAGAKDLSGGVVVAVPDEKRGCASHRLVHLALDESARHW